MVSEITFFHKMVHGFSLTYLTAYINFAIKMMASLTAKIYVGCQLSLSISLDHQVTDILKNPFAELY